MKTHESLVRIRGFIPMTRFLISITAEMLMGLYRFRDLPDTVTVYGSARLKEDSEYYRVLYNGKCSCN